MERSVDANHKLSLGILDSFHPHKQTDLQLVECQQASHFCKCILKTLG